MSETGAIIWTPWRVAEGSGFEVASENGSVGIVQKDHKRFVVTNAFRFTDPDIEAYLAREMLGDATKAGRPLTDAEARAAVDRARTYNPREDNPTDLASIPRFMRWFENPYGLHSLAALIHDDLITPTVNGGELRSDTLSDRFFREMMRRSGVPFLKRWIMWAAVAIRTRFAAGGIRRVSLLLWGAFAVFGMAAAIAALGAWWFEWGTPIGPWRLLALAVVLPFASARLWGEQWGASLVFAIAGFWVIPAGVIAGVGYLVYLGLERIASRLGYR
jgi:hypothetical protein